ncbi:hypothetical protein CPB86DRAFT_555029 [Serendipita vermifera]|nr:hypothetical protein CPB86DRAFT_555029 [Serendipita vermifera]
MAETEVQQATLACNLFNKGPVNRQFTVTFIEEKDLYTNQQPLKAFLDSVSSPSAPLGIAGAYTQCTEAALKDQTAYLLTKIAVATPENVLVISLHFYDEDRPIPPVNHAYLEAALFPTDDTSRQYVGFNVDRLALQLFGEYGLFIRNGIDILSIGVEHIDTTRTIARFIKLHKGLVDTACLTDLVREEWDLDDESDNKLAVRAWVGAVLELASETIALRMANTPPINVSPEPLKIEEWIKLQNVMLSSDRLRGSAPDFVEHDMEVVREAGKFFALSNQFNSRVRVSDFDLEVTFENDVVRAQTVKTKGKKTELKLTEKIDLKEAGQIVKAVTLGKEEATTLDHQRSNFILFALQGRVSIRDNPLLRYIWFPDTIPKASLLLERPLLHGEEFKKLNRSQKTAVNEMLVESPDPRIVLVHGPPGTGKTSVIAAMTQCILLQEQENNTQEDKEAPDDRKREKYEHEDEEEEEEKEDRGPTVWIVAQSNVAVKNVAEKLLKVGIYEFKLIVSQEFHFEWHEHLYEKIKNNMCTSALLPKNPAEVKTFLGDARVILCTLSMLTYPRLRQLGFHTIIPVENVVVDEASQIQLGDLLPMLHIFGSDIKRLCMVGDHKQLAPYGQEQVQGIESIFEIDHIVNSKDSTTTLLSITCNLSFLRHNVPH